MSRVLLIGSDTEVSRAVGTALSEMDLPAEYSAGHADALQRLRLRSFGVVMTDPACTLDEDLALLEEIRQIRPGIKCIVLAQRSTPEEVIAALRARVFACFTPPFDVTEISCLARAAASDSQWSDDIQILSARPGWVSVRVNCRIITAERLLTFARELSAKLPDDIRHEMLVGLREILMNAMEHGAAFNPEQVVELTGVRTGRSMVYYVRDPGAGFRRDSLAHAATADRDGDPVAHIEKREELGVRPGGYGMLLAAGTVDELIYNEIGNEVILIKYVDPAVTALLT
ncbi:ATP-binding response regulator [Edaphobacter aggregans]|uniref:ATP-binding response regulator n=1 Tax=Edaphobacter aggregans TaxID=570835 RepID=UPI00054F9C10|nr:ATP-binding protein [Edaphobacter aggregans]